MAALRHPLGHAAKQRERPQRHDQRRKLEPRNQQRIQRASGAADQERDTPPPAAAADATRDTRRRS